MDNFKTTMEEIHGHLDAIRKDRATMTDMLKNLLIDQGIPLPEKRQKGPGKILRFVGKRRQTAPGQDIPIQKETRRL